jgi:hypothetical protein
VETQTKAECQQQKNARNNRKASNRLETPTVLMAGKGTKTCKIAHFMTDNS